MQHVQVAWFLINCTRRLLILNELCTFIQFFNYKKKFRLGFSFFFYEYLFE